MNTNKGLKAILTLLSFATSAAVGLWASYLAYIGNNWFWVVGPYFIVEALIILIVPFIKDEYKAMRTLGVFQIIGVILMMDYLLLMIFWNDAGTMIYKLSFVVFGAGIALKGLTTLIASIANKVKYTPFLHGFRNNDLITMFYLMLILELVIFKYFYPTTEEIYIYIVEVASNAVLTILAAFLALSTDIISKERIHLSPGQKIKHTINWFNEHEIGMFFGFIFTTYLAILAFGNMSKSWLYVFLGIFYASQVVIRFINYIWHKGIVHKCGDNKIRENRLSSWILFFDAFAYTGASIAVSVAAIILMAEKATVDTSIYLLLFMIIPFGVIRFISAVTGIKSSKKENDTYKIGLAYISLVGAFFSVLEIIAILSHTFPSGLKIALTVIAVVVLQIVMFVISIIFIVHWIRSLVVNRASKER